MATYDPPNWFTRSVGNPLVALLIKLGMRPAGAHILAVRGRTSGDWRTTPVNPLDFDGARYLVAPRGETQWVRNLRAGGEAELRVGSRREPFRAEELPDDAKPPILRAYLKRWRGQVGPWFEDLPDDAPDADFRRIAPDHPVFRITSAS